MTEDISVTFIIPKDCRSDNECSEDMQLAFVTCEQHCGGGLQARWVHESQWTKFDGLTKRDVFVLTEFEGALYEKLQATKCLLVGPRCLSCCLTEGTPIPSGPQPVYTIAMRGLVVTASGLSKLKKEEIKRKVHWMGGIYSTVLTDDTTHLVSDTVLSDKYVKSVEKSIPVMAITWIEAVWEASLRLNVSGASPDFLIHRLPPFTNLQVTTSGIPKKDKQLIMKLVHEQGGIFSGAFQSETTDVVVLTKEGIGSEKYKAALEYGKAVVLPSWVKDSAAKGVALPLAKYRVAGASTSSPLAESRLPDMSLNFSRITNLRPPSNYVDETRSADATMVSGKIKLSQDTKKTDVSIDKEILTAFENLDMSLIKKAGSIFDGFCIWVTGLEGISRERAAACVSRCGGVRYDAAHPRVTHAVAASPGAAHAVLRELPAVPVLSPLWLVKSVQAGRALDEAQVCVVYVTLCVTHAVAASPGAAHAVLRELPAVPVLSPLWLVKSVQAGRALDEAQVCVVYVTLCVTHAVAASPGAAHAVLRELPAVPVLSPLWLVKSVQAGRALDEAQVCVVYVTLCVTHAVAASPGAAHAVLRELPAVPVLSPLWLVKSVQAGRALDEAQVCVVYVTLCVTHAVAASPGAAHAVLRELPAVPVLSPLWLVKSVQAGRALDEAQVCVVYVTLCVTHAVAASPGAAHAVLRELPAVPVLSPLWLVKSVQAGRALDEAQVCVVYVTLCVTHAVAASPGAAHAVLRELPAVPVLSPLWLVKSVQAGRALDEAQVCVVYVTLCVTHAVAASPGAAHAVLRELPAVPVLSPLWLVKSVQAGRALDEAQVCVVYVTLCVTHAVAASPGAAHAVLRELPAVPVLSPLWLVKSVQAGRALDEAQVCVVYVTLCVTHAVAASPGAAHAVLRELPAVPVLSPLWLVKSVQAGRALDEAQVCVVYVTLCVTHAVAASPGAAHAVLRELPAVPVLSPLWLVKSVQAGRALDEAQVCVVYVTLCVTHAVAASPGAAHAVLRELPAVPVLSPLWLVKSVQAGRALDEAQVCVVYVTLCVTHAVAASPGAAHAVLRELPAVPVLSPLWLVKSVQAGRALDEAQVCVVYVTLCVTHAVAASPGAAHAVLRELPAVPVLSPLWLVKSVQAGRALDEAQVCVVYVTLCVTHAVAASPGAAHAVLRELPAVPVLSPLWLVKSVQAGRALDEAQVCVVYVTLCVTHAVAASPGAAHAVLRELPAVPVLSPLWLVKSVQAGRALDEAQVCVVYVTLCVTHAVAASPGAAHAVLRELPAVPVLSPLWLVKSVQAGRALDEAQVCVVYVTLCVTHAVAASPGAAHAVLRELPAVPVLSPLWLVKSVQAGRALDEAQFLIDTKTGTPAKSSARKVRPEPASPMSKRNLALLRRGPLDLPPPTPEVQEPQDELVNHYLSQHIEPEREKTPEPARNVTAHVECQPDITEDAAEDPTEEIEQIFRDIKIEVQGLDEDAICEIGAEVSAAGGALAAPGAAGSHVLVPLDFDEDDLITAGAEAVTVFWVKDCLSQQELVPIQYYHRPVRVTCTAPGPLTGVVASLSTYSGVERAFLDELAKLLGATTQLRFCRRNTANALASTHLICPTASGDKYLGALKWGLPAVRASWLLACVKEGRRVSEKAHLVGDTKAPQPQIEEEPMEVPESEPQLEPQADIQANITADITTDKDKENAMLPPVASAIPRRGSVPSSREQTPKGKGNDVDEMSPASRYIAMARQGLLGCDSQETPKRVGGDLKNKQGGECAVRTPTLEDALSTPNLAALSPTTRRRLQAVRRGEMPSDPIRTPTDPFDKNPSTPDSAFGAALRPGSGRMSPDARKRLWKFVDGLPSRQPEQVIRDKHTPLSEIRNRFLAQFNGDVTTPPSEHTVAPRKLQLQEQCETPPAKVAKFTPDQSPGGISTPGPEDTPKSVSSASIPAAVDAQLQRLNAALTGRLSSQRARRNRDSVPSVPVPPSDSEPAPESQPNTVGWDDTTPAQQPVEPEHEMSMQIQVKRFMLSSNVDNRDDIISMIAHLGGEVFEGAELDPEVTHLLCAAPGRSEKMLGSIAAGRWVLHPVYIAKSRAAGSFLPEEEYEWGNPLATCLPALSGAERILARAAHRWRSARARGAPGAFSGVVALLHVPPARRRLLARLVTAGDGGAPDDEPPYTNDNITVCFADKRYPLSDRDTAWLISKRIPVCAPVLLSSYLTDDPPPKPEEHCLPDFRP